MKIAETFFPSLFLLSALLCLGACTTAGSHARELARETLVQTIEYEENVQKSSRAFQTYLSGRLEDLEGNIKAAQSTRNRRIVRSVAEDMVEKTLDHEFHDSDFRDFIEQTITAHHELEVKDAAELDKLSAEFEDLLKGLEVQEKKLKAIRVKLENLQTEPNLGDRVQQLSPLLDAAWKAAHANK